LSVRRIRAITRKEIQHILRSRSTFILVLLAPLALLFIMAYALTVDIESVSIAVLDEDRSAVSRELIQVLTDPAELDLYATLETREALERRLLDGSIKAGVIIEEGFGSDLAAQVGMPIQVIIDGTEPRGGHFAIDEIAAQISVFAVDLLARAGLPADLLEPIDLRVEALYNPDLEPRVDVVPGLISMVLGMPALSVALALAHEREHGTLEQLLVTPVSKAELLIGKMIPYGLVGLVNVVVIPAVAILTFNIPFGGDAPLRSGVLFFLLSIIFLFAMLGMGTIIGVLSRTQPVALALSFLLIFFPGFFLTGIFFPLVSMPDLIRTEAELLPGTQYAIITRGIFLKGLGFETLWPQALTLGALGVVFTVVAALLFKKRLG
jgi:ABC-2 type transport system permease protein